MQEPTAGLIPLPHPTSDICHLSPALVAWFHKHHRDLPWRRTRDPYAIWVSEIMLQQTRVETTIPYYERFMERFPTVAALADADEDAIIRAWAGLGYYARARNLQRGAQAVISQHGGVLPRDPEALLRLPGVGRYTAGAIASIAYNVPAPILDGNVIRVLCRLFGLRGDPKRAPLHARLWELAQALIPEGQASLFNPAMMELGATVCTPLRPACDRCPVASWCRARAEGVQEKLPETAKAAPLEPVRMVAGVVWRAGVDPSPLAPLPEAERGEPNPDSIDSPSPLRGGGRGEGSTVPHVLLCRDLPTLPARPVGIATMWQLPNGALHPGEAARDGVKRMLRELLGIGAEVGAAAASVKHGVTRYRVTLTAHPCKQYEGEPKALGCKEFVWAPLTALAEIGLPSAHRRVAEALRRMWDMGARGREIALGVEEPQLELAFSG
jgi:A/G-specific adenine glycosylase